MRTKEFISKLDPDRVVQAIREAGSKKHPEKFEFTFSAANSTVTFW